MRNKRPKHPIDIARLAISRASSELSDATFALEELMEVTNWATEASNELDDIRSTVDDFERRYQRALAPRRGRK